MRKYILIVINILWVCFIFYNSLQTGNESQVASNSIVSLIYDIFLKIGIELNLSILSLVVRKLAHIFEFFVLSILLLYLLLEFTTFDKYKIGYTFLIALLVAIIDEVIQSYVPGRGSSVIDVLIDSIGISIGIGLVIVIIYIKHRNQK